MKILITGASGFVGPYLVKELHEARHEVLTSSYEDLDITDSVAWRKYLQETSPEVIVHLAALSGYQQCHQDTQNTWQVNTVCVENLVRTFAEICPQGTFLFVSSGKVYAPREASLDENAPCEPADFYALTKLAADWRLGQLSTQLPIKILRARAFNHTGPGQSLGFLCPDLIHRLRQNLSQNPIPLEVGCLTTLLDLTDVRDMVRGYRLFIEKGATGDILNFGRGQLISIKDIVLTLSQVIGCEIQTQEKQSYDRPYTAALRFADISRARAKLGWSPQITLQKTLHDMWLR